MYSPSISIIVRQIQRWLRAAQQDQDPQVAMLHANYAMADVDMLRQIAPDEQVLKETGIHPHQLQRQAAELQDSSYKRLTGRCAGCD